MLAGEMSRCQWCGREAGWCGLAADLVQVHCFHCKASGPACKSHQEALEEWNRFADLNCERDELLVRVSAALTTANKIIENGDLTEPSWTAGRESAACVIADVLAPAHAITPEKAKELLAAWYERYPAVRDYVKDAKARLDVEES